MANSDAPLAHGDEAELFRAYNAELMHDVPRVVHTSTAQTIEDACSFAWAQFLEQQPDRERNWRGWLFRTAQRQAWLLEGERQETPLRTTETSHIPHTHEAVSPIDDFQIHDDVEEALSIVHELPPRLKHIAMMRALGFKYAEISALTGDSPSRVHRLVVNATERVWRIIIERAHSAEAHASPRAERLWDLEHHPPVWLVQKIGRPIGVSRRPNHSELRRLWRRAALALDDYRTAIGPDRFRIMQSDLPGDRALRQLHERANRAIDAVGHERSRVRRPERER